MVVSNGNPTQLSLIKKSYLLAEITEISKRSSSFRHRLNNSAWTPLTLSSSHSSALSYNDITLRQALSTWQPLASPGILYHYRVESHWIGLESCVNPWTSHCDGNADCSSVGHVSCSLVWVSVFRPIETKGLWGRERWMHKRKCYQNKGKWMINRTNCIKWRMKYPSIV